MRSTRKRYLRLLILMAVLLSATSAARVQSQDLRCNPPYGFCYNYCVRTSIGYYCMNVSFAYFCAPISGGCYGTANCDQCVG
jgi:hypothetical protein